MSSTFLKDLQKDLKSNVTIEIKDTKGKTYLMRPFTVEDDKNIMLTEKLNESKPLLVLKSLREVLVSCNVDGRLTVDDIDTYNIQYLFLQLRAKSKGENVRVHVKCKYKKCDEQVEKERLDWEEKNIGSEGTFVPKNEKTLLVNLSEIKFEEGKVDNNITFKLANGNDITFVLRKPDENILYTIEERVARMKGKYSDLDQLLDLIAWCITEIHYKDEFQDTRNVNPDEIRDNILCSLRTEDIIDNFTPFIEDVPQFKTHLEWVCDNCGKENKIDLVGLDSFLI